MAGDKRDEHLHGEDQAEGVLTADDEVIVDERLALDDDDHLPWLETDDEPGEEGFDARLIVFALIGVLVLAGLLFAIWSVTRSSSGDEQLASGATIEAPDEPYRTRPDDPGGAEVSGTGDLAYEVGEGEGREGQIASDPPAPVAEPSIDRDQRGSQPDDEAAEQVAEAPPAAGGVAVQVGAFSTRAAAEAAWSQFANRFSALSGASHRVVEGRADSGTIYRLQAIAGSREAAGAMCRSIRGEGGDCQVK